MEKLIGIKLRGDLKHFFTTKLEDVIIINIELIMPNAQEENNHDKTELFKISYRKII